MTKRTQIILLIGIYTLAFAIGLYLIVAGKDWRGYVALISTPILHTIVKAIIQNTVSHTKRAK